MKESTSVHQWYYVHTKENHADHASRGLNAEELVKFNWFQGPPFLWKKDTYTNNQVYSIPSSDPEVKMAITFSTTTTINGSTDCGALFRLDTSCGSDI